MLTCMFSRNRKKIFEPVCVLGGGGGGSEIDRERERQREREREREREHFFTTTKI